MYIKCLFLLALVSYTVLCKGKTDSTTYLIAKIDVKTDEIVNVHVHEKDIYIYGYSDKKNLVIYEENNVILADISKKSTNNHFIIKLHDETFQWYNFWNNRSRQSFIEKKLCIDSAKNIYISDSYIFPLKINGNKIGNNGEIDSYILKIQANGKIDSVITFKGKHYDIINNLIVDGNNHLWAVGTSNSPHIEINNESIENSPIPGTIWLYNLNTKKSYSWGDSSINYLMSSTGPFFEYQNTIYVSGYFREEIKIKRKKIRYKNPQKTDKLFNSFYIAEFNNDNIKAIWSPYQRKLFKKVYQPNYLGDFIPFDKYIFIGAYDQNIHTGYISKITIKNKKTVWQTRIKNNQRVDNLALDTSNNLFVVSHDVTNMYLSVCNTESGEILRSKKIFELEEKKNTQESISDYVYIQSFTFDEKSNSFVISILANRSKIRPKNLLNELFGEDDFSTKKKNSLYIFRVPAQKLEKWHLLF